VYNRVPRETAKNIEEGVTEVPKYLLLSSLGVDEYLLNAISSPIR
jgi:hypothetical protein